MGVLDIHQATGRVTALSPRTGACPWVCIYVGVSQAYNIAGLDHTEASPRYPCSSSLGFCEASLSELSRGVSSSHSGPLRMASVTTVVESLQTFYLDSGIDCPLWTVTPS